MTKYNHYAKELDEAFKKAREIYSKAYTEYGEARKAFEELPYMRGMIPADVAARRAKAEYDFKCAETKFDEVKKTSWKEFYRTRENLGKKLAAEIERDCIVNPESIDNAAVELLKSGIMKADDYYSFAEKYDENPTMLKLIAKHAKEAAKDESIAAAERGKLGVIYNELKDGNSKVMRTWNDLCSVSDYCSNVRRPNEYNHTVKMSSVWEECSEKTIENF